MNQPLANSTIRNAGSTAHKVSNSAAFFGPKIKQRDIVNLTTQLAIMTKTGVDVSSALKSIARQCTSPPLQVILEDVHANVLEGNSLSESLQEYSHVFPETFIASIAAGEASGQLPEVLKQLSDLLRSQLRLRNSLRSMMAYPVILLSVSGIVLMALVLFVLPRFAEIFADFDATLPVLTQILINTSDMVRSRWYIVLPILFGMFGGTLYFARTERGVLLIDRWMIYAPVCRDVTRALLVGRTCRLLGIMIDSGVPLLDSLRLARSAIKNSLFQDVFLQLEDDVLNGRGLATGMLASELIPGAASEMMVTAEQTGSLGMVATLVGNHYEEEAETKLKDLMSLVEPFITVVMGVLVAIIVMSVMLPLFDISSAVK